MTPPDSGTFTPSARSMIDDVVGARVYDLEQPRFAGAPTFPAHQPGFVYTLHRRHETDGQNRTSASGMIFTADHSGTHIDALCHQAEAMKLHGGQRVGTDTQTATGFTELGIETVPPIIRRGVLIDIARLLGIDCLDEGHQVSAAELDAASRSQGVEPRPGGVILVRTGNGRHWHDTDRYLRGPGMSAGASQWIAQHAPFAVGADNVAWDLVHEHDPELGDLPGHLILLVRNGILIMENLLLDELAEATAHEFLFICAPLKLRGATGSPVRPLAIVDGA